MSEDTKYYNDEQFERLVRSYDRRKDRGVAGLISRIFYFREAHKYLEPERFERFCERNYIRSNIWGYLHGRREDHRNDQRQPATSHSESNRVSGALRAFALDMNRPSHRRQCLA